MVPLTMIQLKNIFLTQLKLNALLIKIVLRQSSVPLCSLCLDHLLTTIQPSHLEKCGRSVLSFNLLKCKP